MTMGHRITVMRDGKIQQVGTPREVYEHPANTFVATFIGTPPMNLFPATAFPQLPLRVQAAQGVIAGIRPEHLHIGGPIEAVVDLVEPIGHETIVYTTAGSEKLVAIFEPHEAPRVGDQITFGVDSEHVHLFDTESTVALAPR